jgi:hypothetical protein
MIGMMEINTKRGIQWERSQMRDSRRGDASTKIIGLKMIVTSVIRTKRGIQWYRSQITVPYFFYSYGVILRSNYYCTTKMPKFLTGKMCSNFTT